MLTVDSVLTWGVEVKLDGEVLCIGTVNTVDLKNSLFNWWPFDLMQNIINHGRRIVLVPSATKKYLTVTFSISGIEIDGALFPARAADPFLVCFPVFSILIVLVTDTGIRLCEA